MVAGRGTTNPPRLKERGAFVATTPPLSTPSQLVLTEIGSQRGANRWARSDQRLSLLAAGLAQWSYA